MNVVVALPRLDVGIHLVLLGFRSCLVPCWVNVPGTCPSWAAVHSARRPRALLVPHLAIARPPFPPGAWWRVRRAKRGAHSPELEKTPVQLDPEATDRLEIPIASPEIKVAICISTPATAVSHSHSHSFKDSPGVAFSPSPSLLAYLEYSFANSPSFPFPSGYKSGQSTFRTPSTTSPPQHRIVSSPPSDNLDQQH